MNPSTRLRTDERIDSCPSPAATSANGGSGGGFGCRPLLARPSRVSMNSQATVATRSPGNEFPGSVERSRLKPTANRGLESPSGDFSRTQPGNSFPGVGSPGALHCRSSENRHSPSLEGEGSELLDRGIVAPREDPGQAILPSPVRFFSAGEGSVRESRCRRSNPRVATCAPSPQPSPTLRGCVGEGAIAESATGLWASARAGKGPR